MRGFALLGVLGLIACRSLPREVAVEPDVAYAHVATGLTFPSRVAGFERFEITQYDPDGYNVSGGYRLSEPIHVLATVYHYPATVDLHTPSDDEMRSHFSEVRSEITTASPGGWLKSSHTRKFEINGFELSGYFAEYYLPSFHGEGASVESSVYLFSLDGWYLKFRFSTPEQLAGGQGEIDSFVSAFRWPKPGSE